ncbi:MAG: polysaccharide deacetylase family protein [Colwellia sp.]|jgi:hypothetical protein
MIAISCSASFLEEKKYIINIVFTEFLGLSYKLSVDSAGDDYLIRLNDKVVEIKNDLFKPCNNDYLNSSPLPDVTYGENQFTPESDIPILFGDEDINVTEGHIACGIDVFGSSFFMLSRMEEVITEERDAHGRFSAESSVAYKNGFLDRPVVDEYVEMLWNMLLFLDPSLKLEVQKAKNFVTCDLDIPFDPIRRSLKRTILKSAADLVLRKSVKELFVTWRNYVSHLAGIYQYDKYRESIDWIMDENEDAGNKVAFYFITKKTSNRDDSFDFSSKEVIELLSCIHSRGHEIGLHPGYNCFDNKKNFKASANSFRKGLALAGIKQGLMGGRMHYLRWDVLQTPRLWEAEGFNYDSTLSYADRAGFRCGTSKEFTMFDLVNCKPLALKQRPLINMECTIISSRYENLAYSEKAIQRFRHFKKLTKKYNGNYTILWHNSHFDTLKDKEFYRELIK